MKSHVIIKQPDGSYALPDGTPLVCVRPGVYQTPDGREVHRGLVRDFVWCADKIKDPGLVAAKDRTSLNVQGKVTGYHIKKQDDGTVTKEKFMDKSNLVVYNGRLHCMHKYFDFPGSTIASYKPYWFSAGSGGCTTDNPQNPLYPQDHDTELYSIDVIDVANPLYADYGKKKPLNPGVFFITDQIIAKIWTIHIDFAELVGDGTVNLNELGMYLSPSQDPTESTFMLFSHVAFGTHPSTINDAYEFEWWVYI